MLPAFFTVEGGSTVADLLEREGDREYFDPASNRTFTLREIYRSANVPSSSRLAGTAAALSPLEGRVFDVAAASGGSRADTHVDAKEIAALHERLRDDIDPSALAGITHEDDAADLPATALAGVSGASALGKRLADLTIGDIGAMTSDAFLAHATKGVSARQRKQIEQQAAEAWERAQRLTSAYAPEHVTLDDDE